MAGRSCYHGFNEASDAERQARFDKIQEWGGMMNASVDVNGRSNRMECATKLSVYMSNNFMWFDKSMVKFCYSEAAKGLLAREDCDDEGMKAGLLEATRTMFLSGYQLDGLLDTTDDEKYSSKKSAGLHHKSMSEKILIKEVNKVIPCACLDDLGRRAKAMNRDLCCAKCLKSESEKGSTLMKCSRCRTVKYCSRDCQVADWKVHKRACSRIVQEMNGA